MASPTATLAARRRAPLLEVAHPSGLNFIHRNSSTSQRYLIETMGAGVALLDYNNDGLLDIFFVNSGHLDDPVKPPVDFWRRDPAYWNRLYRQNRDSTFTDVTKEAGLSGAAVNTYGMGVATGDYDNDGFTDIYVTGFPGNILYHNNGDGTFTDVSQKSGIAEAKGKSLGVTFNDYDGDGWPDIFVANDRVENFLWHNNGDGTFTNTAMEAGVALSEDGKANSGMGVDFSDFDNDGRPDIVVTNLSSEIYSLYRNDGNGLFTYDSLPTGLGALTANHSGWGVRWEDFDNDGWKDFFAAQSHVQ